MNTIGKVAAVLIGFWYVFFHIDYLIGCPEKGPAFDQQYRTKAFCLIFEIFCIEERRS